MSSTLIVEVCEIKEIIQHDNLDFLEIAVVKGWECLVPKIKKYKKGDKVIFIPTDSLIPAQLADDLGVRNYLVGANKDRVKIVRLQKIPSNGIIIDVPEGKDWDIGYDCKEDLGIIRYEAPIRATMGDAAPEDAYFERYTNIENMRNFPDIFEEGEMVVVTEKLDGTNFRGSFGPSRDNPEELELKAGSHRVKRKKPDTEEELKNSIYWFPMSVPGVNELLNTIIKEGHKNVILYGEIYGRVRGGHKSMHYGIPSKLGFAAFDIKIDGSYVDYEIFIKLCEKFNIPTVPVIATIPFNLEKIKELTKGRSILAEKNKTSHIREGVVVTSLVENEDRRVGRKILKMLNDDYLLLKEKKRSKGEEVDFTDI